MAFPPGGFGGFMGPGMGAGGGGAMGTIWADFGLNISKLKQGFSAAKDEIRTQEQTIQATFDQMGNRLAGIGMKMSMALTAPLVGFGALVVRTTMQFEGQMARVGAISGATGEALQELEDRAREMGRTTSFSATQAAEGMEYLAMAGWETREVVAGIEPVLRMAEAAQLDLGRAADITSDIMTAFAIPAERAGEVTDVLAKTATTANATVEMLGETMAYAAPTAAGLGYDLEEVAAAAGLLADAGIKGSRAGTSLDAVMRDLAGTTKEQRDALREHNIEIYDHEGNMRSLVEIVQDFERATADMNDEQRTTVMNLGLTSRAMRGMNVLLGTGAGQLSAYTDELRDASGAVDAMGETMRDTLRYELAELRSMMEGLLLDIGNVLVPMLREVVIPILFDLGDRAAAVTQGFGEIAPATQTLIVGFVGLTAATGPVLVGLGAFLPLLGKGIVQAKAFAVVIKTGVIPALTAKLALLGPVGWGILGIGTALAIYMGRAREAAAETRDLTAHMERLQDQEERITALVDRYEELRDTAGRSTAQQRELYEVSQEIAQIIPHAVRGWDEYNEALDISVSKVREIAEQHRDMAASIMELRILEQEELLAQTRGEYEHLTDQLDRMDAIYRDISEALEDQHDKILRQRDLENIRVGLTSDILRLIRETSDNWLVAQYRVSAFTTGLQRGEFTLSEVLDMVLSLGDEWLAAGENVREKEEALERMKRTLDDILGVAKEIPEEIVPVDVVEDLIEEYTAYEQVMRDVGEETRRQVEAHEMLGEEYDTLEIKIAALQQKMAELLDQEERNIPLLRALSGQLQVYQGALERQRDVMADVEQAVGRETQRRQLLGERYDENEIRAEALTRQINALMQEEERNIEVLEQLIAKRNELVDTQDRTITQYNYVLTAQKDSVDAMGRARWQAALLNEEFDQTAFLVEFYGRKLQQGTQELLRLRDAEEITHAEFEKSQAELERLSAIHEAYQERLRRSREEEFDLAQAQQELNDAVAQAVRWNRIHATELEGQAEAARLVRDHIDTLRAEGYSPLSVAVREAYEMLQRYEGESVQVQQVMEGMEQRLNVARAGFEVYGNEIEYAQERSRVLEGTIEDLIAIFGAEGVQVEQNAALIAGLRREHEELTHWLETEGERIQAVEQIMADKAERLHELTVKTQLWKQELGETEAETRATEERIAILNDIMLQLAIVLGANADEVQALRREIRLLEESMGDAEEVTRTFVDGVVSQTARLQDAWYDLGQTLHRSFSAMLSNMLQDVDNWQEAVLGFFDRMAGHIIDTFAQIAAYRILAQVPGLGLPAMDFPMFHRGGQVPGRSDEERLVWARGGEWYVPEEVMDAIRGALRTPQVETSLRGGGDEIHVHNTNNVYAMDAASFNEYVREHPDGVKAVLFDDLDGNGPLAKLLAKGGG